MNTSSVCIISALNIYLIELLKSFMIFAPEITFVVQLTIGVLTIIYLFKKIKHFKP
jgi:hypothetical protein